MFKSIEQASRDVQVKKRTTATRGVPFIDGNRTSARQNTQETWLPTPGIPAAFDFAPRILHHFRRHIHTPSATLAPSSSHFQPVTAQHLFLPLSVSLMRILETSGRHFESHCVRACIRLGARSPRSICTRTPPPAVIHGNSDRR